MIYGSWWQSIHTHFTPIHWILQRPGTAATLHRIESILEKVMADLHGIQPWYVTRCHLPSKWETFIVMWSCQTLVFLTTVMVIAISQSKITWRPPSMLSSGHCGGKGIAPIRIHPRSHCAFPLSWIPWRLFFLTQKLGSLYRKSGWNFQPKSVAVVNVTVVDCCRCVKCLSS